LGEGLAVAAFVPGAVAPVVVGVGGAAGFDGTGAAAGGIAVEDVGPGAATASAGAGAGVGAGAEAVAASTGGVDGGAAAAAVWS
jgi:hypothetical protein